MRRTAYTFYICAEKLLSRDELQIFFTREWQTGDRCLLALACVTRGYFLQDKTT
jgi:hypothetical protein